MKLIKTQRYKVKIETPQYTKGEIIYDPTAPVACQSYPDLFQPLYEFEDLTEYYCLGDTLWRIATKNYEDTVKTVMFSEAHLSGNIELFPTKELAEQFLAEKESKIVEKYSQSSIWNCLEYIALFSNKNTDDLTVKAIKENLAVINNQANIALKQLKDDNN